MKKLYIILALLMTSSTLIAQIRSNNGVNASIGGHSAFMDASANLFSTSTNSGKGIAFPSTDLTIFTFNPSSGSAGSYPTAFHGFIVFNTATGATPSSGSGVGGQAIEPGFYYFSNPSPGFGSPTTAGEWMPLGDGGSAGKFIDGDTATDAVFATGNVGIGTADPEGVLDVVSTDSGLILPRLANTAAVSTPVNGMLIYDISTTCVKAYENNAWTGCLFTLSQSDTILAQIGREGDNPDTENSVVTVAELQTIAPALTSLDPGNEMAYQDYIDANPDSFSEPATQVEVQAMVDAVNAANAGGVIATIDCAGATDVGNLFDGEAASGVSSTISYTGGDGDTHTGQTVGSTGVTGLTATLSAGSFATGAGSLVYTITGTPSGTGTASFAIDIGGQTCTLTRTVSAVPVGDATFTNAKNNQYVFSVNDTGLPLDVQGTLTIGTTIDLPYTGGSGPYAAITSPMVAIPAAFCEDGASDWTFGYSYSGGTFSASGNLVVTLITQKAGVDTDWTAKRVADITTINFDVVTAPLVVNATTKTNTIGLDEGGDSIRGSLSTSGAAYDAASVNDIVEITLTEYNNMVSVIPSVSVAGLNTAPTSSAGSLGASFTVNNTVGNSTTHTALISSSYVCGGAIALSAATSTHFAIMSAPSLAGGTTCLTGDSPLRAFTTGIFYFAVKRPTVHNGNDAYIGVRNITGNTSLHAYNSYTVPGRYRTIVTDAHSCGDATTNNHGLNANVAVQLRTSTQRSW